MTEVAGRVGVAASARHHHQDVPDGDHDSGVDENTQAKENEFSTPQKSRTTKEQEDQQETGAAKKKLPMNKVQVGESPSPNLKNVRSKIGSLNNSKYKPGGGNVKIESHRTDWNSKTGSRIQAKNEAYAPSGGDKKVQSQKLQWNAKSKIGSLDNATHKPQGGEKKIESQKVDFKQKAKSKVGSRDNIKHKAGGGDVKVETQKVDYKAAAKSKVGSMDNVKHKPGGGDKKIYDDKEYLRQRSTSMAGSSKASSEGRASGAQSPMPEANGDKSPGRS